MVTRAGAAAVGLLADRGLGEPPLSPHPVALFGRSMRAVERRWYADRRAAGVLHATIGLAVGAVAGVAVASTGVATYLAVAGRALGETAAEVESALVAGDLEGARRLLPGLVGRDPSGLDEKEVARAVVESVAENTVDAIVAPAFWGAVAGAPGALGYRAVNTLDAMVGHRSPRYRHYGWASARLDDAAGWVPARITAVLVAVARPQAATEVFRTVRSDAGAHPSPNGGVAEAAFAAALGLRLGGANHYGSPPRLELRPALGRGRPPEAADIARAVALSRDVTLLLAGALAGVQLAGFRRQPRREHDVLASPFLHSSSSPSRPTVPNGSKSRTSRTGRKRRP
jgi:adenosylcobinamide-phosphate synthase